MVEPTVKGTFNASGGTGNDIAAVVADEMNYTNWINGHQSQVFWSTQGKETTGNFELRLKPGCTISRSATSFPHSLTNRCSWNWKRA